MNNTMESASSRLALPARETFNSWFEISTRNRDTDQYGHVNHAAIVTLFEEGRIALIFAPEMSADMAVADVVIGRLSLTLHKEIRSRLVVDVGSVVTRVGTCSFDISQALFSSSTCFASAIATCILVHKETRRPVPVTDSMRKYFLV